MITLTDRQAEVLRFISDYIKLHGFSPSYRDIAFALGNISTNAVNDHLNILINRGYIKKEPGKSRTIRVLREAPGGTTCKKA